MGIIPVSVQCAALLFSMILFQSCLSITSKTNRYEKFSGNKSRAKLIVMTDTNMTGYSFYPTEDYTTNRTNHNIIRFYKRHFSFPEPGCSCVPNLRKCNYECCYCDLACPLPRSQIDGENWLREYFQDTCRHLKEGKKKQRLLSMSERRELSSKGNEYLCSRPDYPQNAQMPFYQFFCLKFDNSYSSSHYHVRPKAPNLLKLSVLDKKRRFFWPYTFQEQTSYENYCNLSKKDVGGGGNREAPTQGPQLVLDEPKLLQLRVSQLFQFEPPPPVLTLPKGQGKYCIRNRIHGDEILNAHTLSNDHDLPEEGQQRQNRNSKWLQEDAIPNLWRRKISYSTTVDLDTRPSSSSAPAPSTSLSSCQQFRNLLSKAARPWIQRFLETAHGNKSDSRTKISIKRLESKKLKEEDRFLFLGDGGAGLENETFPEFCHSLMVGMEVMCYYTNDVLVQMTYQIMTRDGPAAATGDSVPFFIHIKPVSTKQAVRSTLSRFWSEFYEYECPEQFCWRDVLDFSYLLGDTFSILLAFISAPSLALLLFSEIGYDAV